MLSHGMSTPKTGNIAPQTRGKKPSRFIQSLLQILVFCHGDPTSFSSMMSWRRQPPKPCCIFSKGYEFLEETGLTSQWEPVWNKDPPENWYRIPGPDWDPNPSQRYWDMKAAEQARRANSEDDGDN